MRTSELAAQAGVNTETLRYYERRGLLTQPPRTPGGYRDYPPTAVELLRFIKRAQELGCTLDEVEELLLLDTGGPDSCDAARALAEHRRATWSAGSRTCNGCTTRSPTWSRPAGARWTGQRLEERRSAWRVDADQAHLQVRLRSALLRPSQVLAAGHNAAEATTRSGP